MSENKTLNEKFEGKKLNDAQMKMVAGGSYEQTYADANMLEFFGITNDSKIFTDTEDATWKNADRRAAVSKILNKVGIKCTIRPYFDNDYFEKKTGKKISQRSAWKIMEKYARAHGLYA